MEPIHPIGRRELKRILAELPDPNDVYVALSGGFDYSHLSAQAAELVKDIQLYVKTTVYVNEGVKPTIEAPDRLVLRVEDPSNEKILSLYRAQSNTRTYGNRMGKDINLLGRREAIAPKPYPYPPVVEFHKAVWHLKEGDGGSVVDVVLRPRGFTVVYEQRHPVYTQTIVDKLSKREGPDGSRVQIKVIE